MTAQSKQKSVGSIMNWLSCIHNKQYVDGGCETCFLGYNIILAAIFVAALLILVAYSPYKPRTDLPASNQPGSIRTETAAEAAISSTPTAESTSEPPGTPPANGSGIGGNIPPGIILTALLTLIIAGGTGGILCNLRGLFRWYRDEGLFPTKYLVPFLVRPWMGCLVGAFTFFLASFFNAALTDATQMTWVTLAGRLPFIGLAILAGFGSQEFMERMKDIALTTFGQEQKEDQAPVRIIRLVDLKPKDGQATLPPAKKGEIILLHGALKAEPSFLWRIFEADEQVGEPNGPATAVIIAGGTQPERRALAEQTMDLVAHIMSLTDWRKLEAQDWPYKRHDSTTPS